MHNCCKRKSLKPLQESTIFQKFGNLSWTASWSINWTRPSIRWDQISRSVVSDSLRPHECQASLSITNSRSSLTLMSIQSVMPSSHLILCHPLLLLPPIPPSIRVFSDESTLRMRWPKYWSFSFSLIPSKEIPGLISNIQAIFCRVGTDKTLWSNCTSIKLTFKDMFFFFF